MLALFSKLPLPSTSNSASHPLFSGQQGRTTQKIELIKNEGGLLRNLSEKQSAVVEKITSSKHPPTIYELEETFKGFRIHQILGKLVGKIKKLQPATQHTIK